MVNIMRVLIFMGEGCYPRQHLQDVLGTAGHIPSVDEVASLVKSVLNSSLRWDRFSTGMVDWVSALIIPDQGQPQVLGWNIVHAESPEGVKKSHIRYAWRDDDLVWHGVVEEDSPADSLFNLPELPRLL